MKLIKCNKPDGNLNPIDTPLNVRGELFQSYSKELPDDQYEHYEHNQTKNTWMKLIRENQPTFYDQTKHNCGER